MSKTVDERVVSMQFDNSNFESNVKTSIGTLDKLKQSLNMKGAAKGLEEVDAASKRVNMSGLSSAVETVRSRFSALEVMGVTALANITNQAVNSAKRIASEFTIAPIKTGFQEYETQINAIQTILANTESKGSTLQDVNNALAELNTYADKTIYNFTEMTRNIGTFTAAGVDLDTSVSAIKGIANLAAVSGSTSQQASTAMYQLSQALASGTVKLMDWNSVVNAGMGGQVFQDALKETARIHGIAIDDMIANEGSFRETLKDGWLSSEILTETLAKFTGDLSEEQLKSMGYNEEQIKSIIKMGQTANDAATKVKTFTQLIDTLKEATQSGWTKTWEILIGDFGEAKELLTEISDTFGGIIGSSADSRNELLSGALSTGWKQLLNEGITDAAGFEETVTKVAKEHGTDLSKMIDDETTFQDTLKDGWLTADILSESISKYGENLKSMSEEELEAAGYTKKDIEAFDELNGKLKDGAISLEEFSKLMARPSGRELLIESLRNGLNGILSVIQPVKEAFQEIFPPATAEQLYNIIEGIRDFTAKLKLSSTQSENLKRTFKGVFALLDIGVMIVKAIAGGFMDLVRHILPAGNGFLSFTANIGDAIVKFRDFLENSKVFTTVVDKITSVITGAIDFIRRFASAIAETFSSITNVDTSGIDSFGDKLKSRFEPLAIMGEFIQKIFTGIADIIKKVAPICSALAGKIGEAFSAMQGKISSSIQDSDYTVIFDIINSLLTGGLIVGITNFTKSLKDLADSGGGFLSGLGEIKDALVDTFGALQTQLKSKALLNIAIAIGILAVALIALSFIDPDKLTNSLMAIGGLFAELFGSMAIFEKLTGKGGFTGLSKAAGAMIGLSVAVLILSFAMKKLADLEWEEIGKGLVGIAGLSLILVGAAKLLSNNSKKMIKGATGLILFAAAIKILASVCKDLSSLSWEELGKGLVGVGVLLAEVAAFLKLAEFKGKAVSTAVGIVVLAAGLKILASVCKDFAAMSWEEMGKGLAGIGGLLLEVIAFTKLIGNPKKLISVGLSLVLVGASMKIFASAIADFGKMSWMDIGKGLAAMAGSLLAVALTMRLMPKNLFSMSISMVILGAALNSLSSAFKNMGGMSWEEIGRGLVALGGSLVIIAAAMALMKHALGGAAALLVVSTSLAILAPVLKSLGSMSLGEVGTGLLALAGVFVVLGVAGLVLKPLVPTILALSAAVVLLGVGCAAIGAGVLALSAGLTALAASGAAISTSLVAIVTSVISLIPFLLEQVGVGIIALCRTIAGSADAICDAVATIIVAVVEALVKAVPVLVDGALVLVVSLLQSLVEHTPAIVAGLFDFIIALIDGIAKKLPDLIQAGVNLLMAFFQGVIDALKSIDPSVLVNGILAVGFLSALVFAMASVAAMVPAAMVGVLGAGVVVAELAAVLAAIGALAQIPGLDWLISEGGKLLESIGTAIGQFIGGLIGGIAQGVTSSMPQVATDMSNFMTNLEPFLDGLKSVDESTLQSAMDLTKVILALTGASIIEGITSWLTGGSSLSAFATELVELGEGLKGFSDSTNGINPETIKAAAESAKVLAEMTEHIPNSGGVISWLGGDNSVSQFGSDLIKLGEGLKGFSDNTDGIIPENLVAVSKAAEALVEMTTHIPNSGGVMGWFGGDKSISKFGSELGALGAGLSNFSYYTENVDPEKVKAAAIAAKALAEMTACIPNSGGVVSWFAGDNSISKFALELGGLGTGLSNFSSNLGNVDPEKISAAASAAKTIAEMTACIPNSGGVVSWFAGENSVSKFALDMGALGAGLSNFSYYLGDVDPEKIKMAAGAAKSIAEMTNSIPNEGGINSWFAGDKSISKFALQMGALGSGLHDFAFNLGEDFNPEKIKAASDAAKSVADLTNCIPAEGGITAWFAGEKSISKFALQMGALGHGLHDFAFNLGEDFDPEKVKAASVAATSIAELTNSIPNEGGINSWFAGEKSISKFGTQLGALGAGIANFGYYTTDVNPEKVTAAANAAKTIAEMVNIIPSSDGIAQWFAGEKSLSKFSTQLGSLGIGIGDFAYWTSSVDPEKVSAAANAAKTIAEMINILPGDASKLVDFGDKLKTFGVHLNSYIISIKDVNAEAVDASIKALDSISGFTNSIDAGKTEAAVKAVNNMVDAMHNMSTVSGLSTTGFVKALENLGKMSVGTFVDTVNSTKSDITTAGQNMITYLSDGISNKMNVVTNASKKIVTEFVNSVKNNASDAETAGSTLADKAAKGLTSKKSSFTSAGKNLVQGFANGISENTFMATAKAKAMAEAAYEAAKEALGIESPSKVFYGIGEFSGMGLVNALSDYGSKVYTAGTDMGNSAKNGLQDAISKISYMIANDVDFEPTIRPVLDLSDVESGANSISGMFNNGTLSVNARNVGAISAAMSNRQNGNSNDDIVSSINALRKDISDMPRNTYSINGITYDDGSNIADAMKTIVRAARVERRI
jgi:tape measure domain-containing protein